MAKEKTKKKVEEDIEKEKTEVEERKATIDHETGKVNIHRPKEDDKHKGTEEEVEYVCPKCKASFDTKGSFRDHLKKEHDLELEIPRQEREDLEELERVEAGVPGLEEIIGGGFINDSTNLIAGGPGSGKSTLAMQIAVANIEENDTPVVYLTFEQTEENVLRDMGQYDEWNLSKKIEEDKLTILHLKPEQVRKLVSSGGGIIQEEIKKAEAGILIVDSITMFMELYKDSLEKREALIEFFTRIGQWNITTFLVAEKDVTPKEYSSQFLDFQVDSILLLYHIKTGNVRERAMEIFKMRATDHSHRIYPFKIHGDGINIYPQESVF